MRIAVLLLLSLTALFACAESADDTSQRLAAVEQAQEALLAGQEALLATVEDTQEASVAGQRALLDMMSERQPAAEGAPADWECIERWVVLTQEAEIIGSQIECALEWRVGNKRGPTGIHMTESEVRFLDPKTGLIHVFVKDRVEAGLRD
tara:strand:- start:84 stop:533 length:450 start_codon:yes stop_codon:yes gene_type:complete